jgi:hypothetical protein
MTLDCAASLIGISEFCAQYCPGGAAGFKAVVTDYIKKNDKF